MTLPYEWQDDAVCAQTAPDVFFPEKGESTKDAKKLCAVCPVARECLEYALTRNITDGIWGGLSPMERRTLRRAAA